MKRIFAFVLIASLTLFSLPAAAWAGPRNDLGKVNGDDYIDLTDVMFSLKHVAGINNLPAQWAKNIDVNGDGEKTAVDSLLILKYVLGLIDIFPADVPDPVDVYELIGYITDDDIEPIIGATISCPQNGNSAKTDAEGKYTIYVPTDEAFDLTATQNGYQTVTKSNITAAALDADTSVLNIVLNTLSHKISGKITFINPVDQAEAELYVVTDQKHTATIDANGDYDLNFAANKHVNNTPLYLTYNGITSIQRIVSLGETEDTGAIINLTAMRNADAISGVALNGSGVPLVGAIVKFEPVIDMTSAGNANTRTIASFTKTNELGEYKSEGFLPWFPKYRVSIETLTNPGNSTDAYRNEFNQIVYRKITTIDIIPAEEKIALNGIASGNFYSPASSFNANLYIPTELTAQSIKWFIKSGGGAYTEQIGESGTSLAYAPSSGVSTQIKAEVTLNNGKTITRESETFKYNYVGLSVIDPARAANFTINPNGTITVTDTVKESDNTFYSTAKHPEIISDITFINGFKMSAVFEFQSGTKQGTVAPYAGLLASGRRTNGRTNVEYPSGGISYNTSGTTSTLTATHANEVKISNLSIGSIPRIRIEADYNSTIANDTLHTANGSNNIQNCLSITVRYYNADTGELLTTLSGKTANSNTLLDNGFLYPGLTFDNINCTVSDIMFTSEEETTIRRDLLKTLLDTPGASSHTAAYATALALHNRTDGSDQNGVIVNRDNYRPFKYRDDVNSATTTLKSLLGL